jgi:flavin reductase (DIM6/NTAB) family NADH-FMN oxidoreductase RutF
MPGEPSVAAYKRAAGQFASGITVVTTVLDGVDHAMTASSFASVSLDPLLVLVCAERQTRFHDAVLVSGFWGVSVLGADELDAAAWFATEGRPLEGQLDRFPYLRGALTGAPLLDGALSTLECRTHGTYDGGDHTVVVGRVVACTTLDESRPPLLHVRGGYTALGAPRSADGGRG